MWIRNRQTRHRPSSLLPGMGAAYVKFWRDHADKHECIPFPFTSSTGKVVNVTYLGKRMAPHRLACLLKNGTPKGDATLATHSCGNGHLACINPHHVQWGTAQSNAEDRVEHAICGKMPEPTEEQRRDQFERFKVASGQRTVWSPAKQRVKALAPNDEGDGIVWGKANVYKPSRHVRGHGARSGEKA